MRIFLLGFMGSGKSVIAAKIAKKLKLNYIDLDKKIESKYNKTIIDIFAEEGETIFREKENKILKEICSAEDIVIATGGGTPCFNNNMELIKQAGISVYIKLPAKLLLSRLTTSKAKTRPLIKNLNEKELLNYIETTLAIREKYYIQADITINEIIKKTDDIIRLIQNLKQ